MVLVLSGVLQEEPPSDTRSLFQTHPMYKESASQLLSIPSKVVGPAGLLYVRQRELAVTVPHDSKIYKTASAKYHKVNQLFTTHLIMLLPSTLYLICIYS